MTKILDVEMDKQAEKCEYSNRILKYKCPHPVVKGGLHCKFHDPKYGYKNPDDVKEEYNSLVNHVLDHHQPLICIGFVIPQANHSKTIFPELVDFSSAIFLGQASFNGASFINGASFKSTTFTKETNFSGATFAKEANFSGAVTGDAYFNSVNFLGDVDFRNVNFGDKTYFINAIFSKLVHFSPNTTFTNIADFTRAAFFKTANFNEVRFKKQTNFESARFFERATFTKTIFEGQVDLRHSRFEDEAVFDSVTFQGQVIFKSASFNGEANFFRSTYEKNANYSLALFNKVANFSLASFVGEADFSLSKFVGSAKFSSTDFMNKAVFNSGTFGTDASFLQTSFMRTPDFTEVLFENAEKALFDVTTKLSVTSFINTNLTKVRFSTRVEWEDLLKSLRATERSKASIWRKTLNSFRIKRSIKVISKYRGVKAINLEATKSVYRNLKENYENSFRFRESDRFYIAEMELRRLYREKDSQVIRNGWFRRNFSLTGLYYRISEYGYNPIRPVILAIILVLAPFLYSMILETIMQESIPSWDRISNITTSMYTLNIADTLPGQTVLADFLRLAIIPILGTIIPALLRALKRSLHTR